MTSAPTPELRARTYAAFALALHGGDAGDVLRRVRDVRDEAAKGGHVALADALAPWVDLGRGVGSEEVRRDFHALFLVPGPSYVQPYESVHADPPLVVDDFRARTRTFGPSTEAVRRFYGRVGLEIAPEYNELPDFVGLEVACLEYLCAREAEALAAGGACKAARASAASFLDGHVTRWVPSLCQQLERVAATPYHRGMAKALAAFLAIETQELCRAP